MRVVGVAAAFARESHHLVARVVRQLAVAGEGRHVEVDGAVRGVRVAVVEETTDHVDHAVDRLGGAGLGEGRSGAERVHVGAEAGELGLGEVEVGHAELAGLRQDRVVDVGDVAHHAHVVAELLEPADEEVVGEVGGGVAEVGGVVGRDAAHVHAHDRADLEGDDGALRGVEELDRSCGCGGHVVRRGPTPSMRSDPSPLCRRLTVSRAAEKVSSPIAFSSGPASKARRSGMASTRSRTVVATFLVTDDQDVAGERRADVGERRGGHEVERGHDVRGGRCGLHLGGDRARGRRDGDELAAPLLQPVGHRDHDLARELVRVGPSGRDRGVPDRGEDDEVGVGGILVRARLEPGDPVAPALA